jgi:hypothetical protein
MALKKEVRDDSNKDGAFQKRYKHVLIAKWLSRKVEREIEIET